MEDILFFPQFSNLVITVLAFFLCLSIIVFVHEFGHYFVGKLSGIHAEVFSIGFGPVLPNSSQVTDIDSSGNYVKSESSGLANYMVHMLKVQKLIVDKFGITARPNDNISSLSEMIKSLGSGSSAEND